MGKGHGHGHGHHGWTRLLLSEAAEDYLERLYGHEVEGQAAPEPAEARVVSELSRRGLVEVAGAALSLTPSGREEAEAAVRRHRLAERLLHDVIDLHGTQVDQAACEFEHSLHHGVDERICILLGHPRTCPHGRPIPRGRCCHERLDTVASVIAQLSDLKSGERGAIAYLSSTHPDTVQKLMALGALPGATLSVIQTSPSVVFQVGQTQMAIDHDLARNIYVRRDGETEHR